MASRPSYGKLIHCETCGEDYSATYKRCPFCGAKNAPRPTPAPVQDEEEFDDGYVFDGQDLFDDAREDGASASRAKGGKRLAGSQGRKAPEPVNWPRLITFLCSLVIIVAALIIVFTVIYPQLRGEKDPVGTTSTQPELQPSEAVSLPSAGPAVEPSADPAVEPSDGPDAQPSAGGQDQTPSPDPNQLLSVSFRGPNDGDFTLQAGESHTITLNFDPSNWPGSVTWSSSNPEWATVDANGKVTNVNATDRLHMAVITAVAGDIRMESKVYCRGVVSDGPSEPPEGPSAEPTAEPSAAPSVEPSAQPSSAPSGGLTPGAKGKIVGADGGLRVRSGPGTAYSVKASLINGNEVTIVSDAGNGWYEITYRASGGTTDTGYIMGEYISVN